MIWFCPDNIEIAGKWGFHNIEIRNSLSEWYDNTEKYLHTILPVFLLVLFVHIAQMKVFLTDKKAINLQASNLKFAQIVAFYKAYNL